MLHQLPGRIRVGRRSVLIVVPHNREVGVLERVVARVELGHVDRSEEGTAGLDHLIAFGINGNVDWLVAVVVFIGSGTGAWLGAKYQNRIPEHVLAGVFSLVLFVSAVRMWI